MKTIVSILISCAVLFLSIPSFAEKIYSVSEIVTLLASAPQELKDKEVLIKAYKVDGVRGIDACHDYFILTDVKDKDAYLRYVKLGNKILGEDLVRLKAIPVLLTC